MEQSYYCPVCGAACESRIVPAHYNQLVSYMFMCSNGHWHYISLMSNHGIPDLMIFEVVFSSWESSTIYDIYVGEKQLEREGE